MIAQKGSEAASDSQVDPCLWVVGIHSVHVVPLLVRHHLQGQLVVIAQEKCPVTRLGDHGCLVKHIDDGKTIFHTDGDEHSRHEGEVEGHMAFIPIAKVGCSVLRPLVGFGQQHTVFEFLVYVAAYLL